MTGWNDYRDQLDKELKARKDALETLTKYPVTQEEIDIMLGNGA